MERGLVVDEHGSRLQATSPYREGACIFYYREPDLETAIPFEEVILYEDDNILVVDKPHFLPTVPAGRFLRETLLVRLRRKHKSEALTPVHRLDRETAGLVLFSVNPETRPLYTKMFREGRLTRIYEALAADSELDLPVTRRSRVVTGEPFFRMQEIDGPANAETLIELKESAGDLMLYRLQPATGKKHQLRLHMASLGIPIVNDRLYPQYLKDSRPDDYSRPLKLLAKFIQFVDPPTGHPISFESNRDL